MKKISYLELSAIFLAIIITFNSGLNTYILKQSVGVDSWIAITIAYIIGIIPVLLTIYLSNYQKELNLFEKNKHLFGDVLGTIINTFISIVLFMLAITILYNVTSFITTQFLYRTPMLITSTLLILLCVYCSIKEINVIAHVSIILITINIFMFIISNISLIGDIKLDNLLPILKTTPNNLFISALKITIINTIPTIIILIIPKSKITNAQKFTKWILTSYLIGGIISIITSITTISILGVHLTNAFEYSEYMVLKKVKLFGFLERVENIISLKWITEAYIYLTLIIYTIAKNIPPKNNKTFKYLNIIIGILLIITNKIVFNNITAFNNFTNSKFISITSLLIIAYIIMLLKIAFNKYKERKVSKKTTNNLQQIS